MLGSEPAGGKAWAPYLHLFRGPCKWVALTSLSPDARIRGHGVTLTLLHKMFTSEINCAWLLLDQLHVGSSKLKFVHSRYAFTTAGREQFIDSAVSEMLVPLARKQMILPSFRSGKSRALPMTAAVPIFVECHHHA